MEFQKFYRTSQGVFGGIRLGIRAVLETVQGIFRGPGSYGEKSGSQGRITGSQNDSVGIWGRSCSIRDSQED